MTILRIAGALKRFVSIAALLGATSLGGCIVPIVAGTAAGGYSLATEQRSPQQLARDAAIGAAAHKYWADASSDLARDVDATVYDGDLLITGTVPNRAMKDKAEELAHRVDGVRAVYDEVRVGPPTAFGQDMRDNYVSNALRAQLLADSQVRSTNYIVHTLDGVVYIMGYARNGAERDRVLSYARNLANVGEVKSFIRVGNERPSAPPPRATGGESVPPPPPPEPPSAAPRNAPIQVTPLQ
jgi:osmotically-inducible protein OsmY